MKFRRKVEKERKNMKRCRLGKQGKETLKKHYKPIGTDAAQTCGMCYTRINN
ncbi:MAG: hypothetical protein M3258_07890 [Thermoproteota archaeon]|jgi:hypothetical protein|nr:hypothetical protein [Thermoproteota archaeon]